MKSRFVIAVVLVMIAGAFSNPGDQVFQTKLKITILDYLGNPVEGATVELYSSAEDYEKEENPAAPSQETDEKGRVLFKGLEPIVYYVHAHKGDMNNYTGAVTTSELVAKKVNVIRVIIE